jgi:hypothetical protein
MFSLSGEFRTGSASGRGGWGWLDMAGKVLLAPASSWRGIVAPVTDPSGPANTQIVKASPETQKRVFLALLLVLTAALACLIYRSNSHTDRRVSRSSTSPRAVSGSVGRFFSGLLSERSRVARSDARIEDLLELKGIILSRQRPVAMINTTAFGEGETAPMSLASREYSILCMDIAPDQVKIRADERDPVTLQLKVRLQ